MSHLNTYKIVATKKTWHEWGGGGEPGMNTEKRRERDVPFCHKLGL